MASIQLVNEPLGGSLDMDVVRQFYMDGWGDLKNSHVAISFHDAFQGVTGWNDWGSGMWNLLLDTHHYEIFDSSQVAMSPATHVSTACAFGKSMASNNKWTISGEWTGAMTDCAKYLNGYGKGARTDGSLAGSSAVGSCAGQSEGSVSNLSQQERDDMSRFIEAQLDAFESAAGWIFWTWRTESQPAGWDLADLVKHNVFPSPVTDRKCKCCLTPSLAENVFADVDF